MHPMQQFVHNDYRKGLTTNPIRRASLTILGETTFCRFFPPTPTFSCRCSITPRLASFRLDCAIDLAAYIGIKASVLGHVVNSVIAYSETRSHDMLRAIITARQTGD